MNTEHQLKSKLALCQKSMKLKQKWYRNNDIFIGTPPTPTPVGKTLRIGPKSGHKGMDTKDSFKWGGMLKKWKENGNCLN